MLKSSFTKDLVEAGCDEVGRGCLAGPVVAAAVILPKKYRHKLLNDSKQLSREERQIVREDILRDALAWAVAEVSHTEIDEINILNASFKAMHLALDQLKLVPELLLIDGNRFKPYRDVSFECIIKGDSKYKSIAAASVLAKTYRDELMTKLSEEFPGYGWNTNVGYPTNEHREGITKLGITPYHRRSFQLLPSQLELFGDDIQEEAQNLTTMSSNNAAFSGSVPKNYEKYLGPMFFEPYAVDIVSRITKPYSKVLELACGTGRVTLHLRKHLPSSSKLVATDLNPDMIAIAQSQVNDPSIEWLPADMQQLPFADESFECVVCQFGVMFVPDKAKAFGEIFRVLKKGGTFLFNTWDRIENNGVARIANREVTKFFDNIPPAFYGVPFSMFSPQDIEIIATTAGFSSVAVELVKKEGRSESAEAAARGMIEGTPIIKEIKDKDAGAVDGIIDNVQKEITASFGSPVVSPLQAFVSVAIK